MDASTAAWLSAAAGTVTGSVSTYVRRDGPPTVLVVLSGALGAIVAVLCYGAFLAAGYLVSFMFFSGPPDPEPALLCVILCCPLFLLGTWLQSYLRHDR